MTIVCLGEALIDQVVTTTGERQDFPGGAPTNVAVALVRLGVPSALVGAIGQDTHGSSLADLLRQAGVNCAGLQVTWYPTRIVEVLCTEAGDRTFGGFVGGHTTDFADAHLDRQKLPLALLQSTQALVTGTLGLAYPETRAAMERAAAIAIANGGRLIVDVNWRPTFWPDPTTALPTLLPWLQQAHWLKVSLDEALLLFETDQVAVLADRFPQANILLTDGAQGCHYAIAGMTGHVPAFGVEALETTGAGDAFLAGILDQLVKHQWHLASPAQLHSMITFANAMGALTTLKPGAIAAQPTGEELLAFLHQHTDIAWTR
jgi:fructokinase